MGPVLRWCTRHCSCVNAHLLCCCYLTMLATRMCPSCCATGRFTYPYCLPATPAGEWRASIEDSHPPSPARDAALATHDKEVDTIAQALTK
jgi:hypothetical protein